MKWLLLLAILLEVCGTTSMKLSRGFVHLVPSICMFGFYALSLVVFNIAVKRIPVGVAYAIWSALGIVLISSIDVIYFKEPLSSMQIVFICLIIVGVFGLNFTTTHPVF